MRGGKHFLPLVCLAFHACTPKPTEAPSKAPVMQAVIIKDTIFHPLLEMGLLHWAFEACEGLTICRYDSKDNTSRPRVLVWPGIEPATGEQTSTLPTELTPSG